MTSRRLVDDSAHVVIQEGTSLSSCLLWDSQKAFFDQEGINAWHHKVPYYITCNPYIADCYANIILQYLRERDAPVAYIIELGAGSGLFSFYTLKRLKELQLIRGSCGPTFIYVMTDYSSANIEYWRNHPAFQEFIEAGVLDFAVFDVETAGDIRLLRSGLLLQPPACGGAGKTPLVVLANYIFDSVSHDAFRIRDGQLQEGLVRVTTPPDNVRDGRPSALDKVNLTFSYRDITSDYYQEPEYNALLDAYVAQYPDTHLLLPIGGLRSLTRLRRLSGDDMLVLCTDSGYAKYFRQYCADEPVVMLHVSFSMVVNFDALGRYFHYIGGDSFFQTTQQSIMSAGFVSGRHFDQLPETRLALHANFDHTGPGDLFSFVQHICASRANCSLETLVALLNATHWDPRVFTDCLDQLLVMLRRGPGWAIQDIIDNVPKIIGNFYRMPGVADVFFKIGLFLQAAGRPLEAIECYELSMLHFGRSDVTFYNIGQCQQTLGRLEQAKDSFRAAVAVNPDYIMARGWLARLEAGATPASASGSR